VDDAGKFNEKVQPPDAGYGSSGVSIPAGDLRNVTAARTPNAARFP
jgi:hypothetical protein